MTTKLPRPAMPYPRRCICGPDQDVGVHYSVCGVPCLAKTHLPEYLKEQIRLYDLWVAESEAPP